MTDREAVYALVAEHNRRVGRNCTKADEELLQQRIRELPTMTFQHRTDAWVQQCFGPEIAADMQERNHRFLEESLELVQSTGCTASEAHQLVDYVFGRDKGQPEQECGGVMVTLAALCNAADLDMADAADKELHRCWGKIDEVRRKQERKPKHSPLP